MSEPNSPPDARTCPQCGRTYGPADRFCTVDGATLVSAGPATVIGSVIADRFLVLERLGQGGMGEVYLAEHVRIRRKVALKLMRPWMIGDPVAVGRFHREAENASQISHQHVAQVYDFGESSDGLVYLAMEFVEGEPLSSILDRELRLHAIRTVDLARQIAEALSAAHSLGILHRDLKPDNVMVGRTRSGTDHVKLVDFGIARAMDRSTQAFTSTGLIVGTPDYMSPEQMSGDTLDGRSDLYALALIAFRALTGGNAYPTGASAEALVARLTQLPLRLSAAVPDVPWPTELQQAFDRALSANPADRHGDVLEFVAEMDAAVAGMPLGDAEHDYLRALSLRHPTPTRGGAVLGAAASARTPAASLTPTAGLTPVESTAVATPPAQQAIGAPADKPPAASQQEVHPWSGEITPVELPASAGLAGPGSSPGAAAPVTSTRGSARRRRGLIAAVTLAAAALTVLIALQNGGQSPADEPADSTAAFADSAQPPDTGAASLAITRADAARVLDRVQRASVAIWASGRRGSGVLVDDAGIVLTSAALVGDAPVIDVFVEPTTRLRGTLVARDERSGLAALLVSVSRCRRCLITEPDTALTAMAGDSVLALPPLARGDAPEVRSVVAAVTAEGIPSLPPRSLRTTDGLPLFAADDGALLSIAVRDGRDRVTFASLSSLRSMRVTARGQVRGVPANDTIYPTWPAAVVPTRVLNDASRSFPAALAAYRVVANGYAILAMSPQVMRWRQSLANPGTADSADADPFRITPTPARLPAPDPIGSWRLWREVVTERRPVVVLEAAPEGAAFPDWPQRVGDIRGARPGSLQLLRDGQPVAAIDSGRIASVGNADAFRAARREVPATIFAVHSPLDFVAGARLEVVVTDQRRQDRTVTIPLPPAMIQALAADFSWLRRTP